MGRIAVTELVSLDGVAEAPGGEEFKHRNWSFQFDRGEDRSSSTRIWWTRSTS